LWVCREPDQGRILKVMPRVLIAEDRKSVRTAVNALIESGQASRPKAPTRILIAEDRESMRHALRVLFGLRENWEVCGEAEDANEAILKAEQLRPDLIVLDYKMRHTDGLQAADGIFKVLPDVPIVMFTLYKTDELEHAANLIGIRCVVGKEDGVHSLLSAMEQQLPPAP
jgi:two-component system, response regulator PdtaR